MLDTKKLIEAYRSGEIETEQMSEEEYGYLKDGWEASRSSGFENSRFRPSVARVWTTPPKWLIHGLIPREGIGQIYGASGCGKTYFALDLALSVANEEVRQWFGRDIRRHGGVFYVALEGVWNLQNRVQAWLQGHPGTNDADLYTFEEESLDLTNGESCLELMSDITNVDKLYRPVTPSLVVIDTQRLAMSGDEDTTQATAMMKNLITISKELDVCVVLVHHEGYDETHARGSTVVKDAIAFQLHLKKDKKVSGTEGEVFLEKSKYGPTPPENEALAGYRVELVDLQPWNPNVHDFEKQIATDEYGEVISDGYCTEAPLKSIAKKVGDAIRSNADKELETDKETVRELFANLGSKEVATVPIRNVLGGRTNRTSKTRLDALVTADFIRESRRQGTSIFWSLV